jgi:hypothetical protein
MDAGVQGGVGRRRHLLLRVSEIFLGEESKVGAGGHVP